MAYSDVVATIALLISILAAAFSFIQSRQSKRQADAAHRDIDPTFYIVADLRKPQDVDLVIQNHNRKDIRIIKVTARLPLSIALGERSMDGTVIALAKRFQRKTARELLVDLPHVSAKIPGSPIGGPETSQAKIDLHLLSATPAPFKGDFDLVLFVEYELLGEKSDTRIARVSCRIPPANKPTDYA